MKTIDGLFSNIEDLMVMHTEFFAEISMIATTWTEESKIGDVMSKLAMRLGAHASYSVNYKDVDDLVKKMKKGSAEQKVIEVRGFYGRMFSDVI